MKHTESVKLVKSAIRTVALFALFAEKKKPLTLAELSQGLDAPKSSCYELLQTLIHLGYLLVIDGGKSYYPSKRLSELADQISQFNPVKEKIQNRLRRLRDETRETIFIGRLQGHQVIYTEVFDGQYSIRYNVSSGELKAIHATALGKALLACLTDSEQDALISQLKLRRFNEQTITRKKDLRDELLKARKEGIYVSRGENSGDVMGIACPIRVQGYLLGIGMAGPESRMQKKYTQYRRALLQTAEDIQA